MRSLRSLLVTVPPTAGRTMSSSVGERRLHASRSAFSRHEARLSTVSSVREYDRASAIWPTPPPLPKDPAQAAPKPTGRQHRTIQFDADVGKKKCINIGVLQGKNIEGFHVYSLPQSRSRGRNLPAVARPMTTHQRASAPGHSSPKHLAATVPAQAAGLRVALPPC